MINKVYEDDIKTVYGWLLEIKQKAESKNIFVETKILLNPIINPVSDALAKYTQENIPKIIIVGSSNKKELRGIFHTDIAAELIKNV